MTVVELQFVDNRELDRMILVKDRHHQTDWLADCIGGETGRPLPILANALIGLRHVWPDAFAYDEMLCVSILRSSLDGANDFHPRSITDVDVGYVQDRLQHLGLKRIARDTVHQAVNMRAHECRFHPVRDYLDDLQWDGISRVEKSFANYFGTKSFPPYAEAISRMFPLAAATGPRMYVAAISRSSASSETLKKFFSAVS